MIDILKVPHHGSKNASELEFLESAAPQTAVISCGRGNIYGHPSPETLERLGEAKYAVEIFLGKSLPADSIEAIHKSLLQEHRN